jgi:RimK family alpha-L-glutamate ligase
VKKSLLLFAQSSVEKGLADPTSLCGLISQPGKLEATWAYLDDLVFGLSADGPTLVDARNEQGIQQYDSVYFRYWAMQEGHANAAARICKILGVPFIDDETIRAGSRNKMSQYVMLHEAGILIPRTLMSMTPNLKRYYKAAGFQFPFIMKDKSGTRGQGNFLVHSEAEMDKIGADFPDRTFIIQEYIPNDGDYRILVIGGKVRMAIHRKAAGGSHLNNISRGGSAELVDVNSLSADLLVSSVRAAAIFGRDVAGVDMVESKSDGQHYCFEVNRAPQIEHASFQTEKAAILGDYLASL